MEPMRKKAVKVTFVQAKAVWILPILLGTAFCFYYLSLAADNVAFSDYVRLINSYLPDVGNPAKFFVPDILTRVPITYLGRIINVKLLGYNTFFDMALGVLGLGLGAAALSVYAGKEKKISYPWYLMILFVYFSLNKWEMLTNGTGWVCFAAVSGFICHYVILDRAVRTGHCHRRDRIFLMALPSFLTLLVAGPYCGSYSALLTLVYLVMLAADYRKKGKINRLYLGYLAAVLIPLALYLWSNSYAGYVHRGAVTDGNIISQLIADPLFFVTFLLNAFASAVLGQNQIVDFANKGSIFGSDPFVYLMGAAVIFLYLYSLYLNLKYRLYEKTIFPLLMILSGGINHLLILSARWIFLKDSYGMTSRYALQYQMGIIGILLTFAVVMRLGRETEKSVKKGPGPITVVLVGLGACLILAGNAWTTKEELKTAPFRKDYLQISRELAMNYRTAGDAELVEYLHNDPDSVRKAMKILEENNLNLFRK